MRNFLKIADADVVPLLQLLAINPDLWDENTLRTQHENTAHGATSDVWVWFNDVAGDVVNDIQTYPYRAWDVLHPLKPIVLDLMRRVNGTQLGRVLITKLPPGKSITPHVDGGAPATFYTRFQIALQTGQGTVFHIGDEQRTFKAGEIWWIDNTKEHSVVNNGADDRIVCIVDIKI